MLRKLFLGSAVAAVAALALLLTVGSTAEKPQPAEAVVASISTTTSTINNDFWAQLHIVAEDDLWANPNISFYDLRVTATAGDFGGLDICALIFPPYSQVGCAPVVFPVLLPACYYDEFTTPCIILDTNGFPIAGPFFPTLVGPADRDITICNTGESVDFFLNCSAYPGSGFIDLSPFPEANTTEVELWWRSPGGFPGGTVTFTAWQGSSVKSTSITVLGAPASIDLFAFRHYSNESSECSDTPVYVIAAEEYTFNNPTTFDNNRAVLCAEVRDSNGSLLSGVDVLWTTNDGSLALGPVTATTGGLAYNELTSGGTGHSGDIATVKAQAGSASDTVNVQFGGDPASCSIPDFPDVLDIGDSAHFVATFLDSKGNLVPDGIVGHIEEVDSGDGGDNVDIVSSIEDTVKGQIEGDIIAAISGLTTIAASLEQLAGPDVVCTEALELSGDVHLTPIVCEDKDGILYGTKPPLAGGWGTFAFCGGTYQQLLTASGCPMATSVFFYNKPNGTFAVWIPGSEVAAVNAEIYTIFPPEHTPIPAGTIFTAKCK